jgi:hypothetical protein
MTHRPASKIEKQIVQLANKLKNLEQQSPAWYALKGKIDSLVKEHSKSKQFEFLAK